MTITCPRCQSADLEPCDAVLDASGEIIPCTHRCVKCHEPFRYVPPPFNPPHFAAKRE